MDDQITGDQHQELSSGTPRIDGHRESTESWFDLLRGCERRGMAAPVLAVGDGVI
jgi:hypothetical protein